MCCSRGGILVIAKLLPAIGLAGARGAGASQGGGTDRLPVLLSTIFLVHHNSGYASRLAPLVDIVCCVERATVSQPFVVPTRTSPTAADRGVHSGPAKRRSNTFRVTSSVLVEGDKELQRSTHAFVTALHHGGPVQAPPGCLLTCWLARTAPLPRNNAPSKALGLVALLLLFSLRRASDRVAPISATLASSPAHAPALPTSTSQTPSSRSTCPSPTAPATCSFPTAGASPRCPSSLPRRAPLIADYAVFRKLPPTSDTGAATPKRRSQRRRPQALPDRGCQGHARRGRRSSRHRQKGGRQQGVLPPAQGHLPHPSPPAETARRSTSSSSTPPSSSSAPTSPCSSHASTVSSCVTSSLANGRGFLRGLGLWFLLGIPSTYTNSMIRFPPVKTRHRLPHTPHTLRPRPLPQRQGQLLPHRQPRRPSRRCRPVHHHRHCPILPRRSPRSIRTCPSPCSISSSSNYALSRSLGPMGVLGLASNYLFTGWILRQVTPAFGKLAAIEAKLEGDFRSAHSRLITNAEEIAFYNGASIEAGILNRAYIRLVRHINSIFKIRVALQHD
ncbi:hypothetical protein L1887_57836 [Cichorium endivia]|nr:hypothetical protein L1887_57836 [Cichorium endivia]